MQDAPPKNTQDRMVGPALPGSSDTGAKGHVGATNGSPQGGQESVVLQPIPEAKGGSLRPSDTALLIAAAVGGLLLVWGLQRSALKKREREEEADRAARPTPRSADADVRELRELKKELRELSDTLVGQIDARAARLESLLARAEAAAQQIERVPPREAPPPTPAQGRGREAVMGEPRVGVAPALVLGDVPVEHRRVIELAELGREPLEIAQSLAMPIGQVELILALRRPARR